MTLEPPHEKKNYGIYKRYQMNRVKKLLVKLKRPNAYNESLYGQKSRTQLTDAIKKLKEELKLQ